MKLISDEGGQVLDQNTDESTENKDRITPPNSLPDPDNEKENINIIFIGHVGNSYATFYSN